MSFRSTGHLCGASFGSRVCHGAHCGEGLVLTIQSRMISIWPTVTVRQAITGLPALQRPGIKASQSTGRGKPCTVGAGLRDISHQDLAVFQAGHTSSPSLKTAASFFERQVGTVSARALSLRCYMK